MNPFALNQILVLHRFFVNIKRQDSPVLPIQRKWLTRIEKHEDGRLILHVCEPSDPTDQLRLGQCELGSNVFVTIQEDLGGKDTFSLRDSGWEVSDINLPLLG